LTEISYPFGERTVYRWGDRKARARERPAFGRVSKNRRRALAQPHDARFPVKRIMAIANQNGASLKAYPLGLTRQ
jgi:hypothetical protein